MTKTHWSDALVRMNACPEAVRWAREQRSLAVAWRRCRRGDWMLWLLGHCAVDRRLLVRAAALCAEPAAALADEYTEAVCLSTIQTCIAWSEGEATDEELRASAWAAAWKAAAWAAAWKAAAWAAARAGTSAAARARASAAARARASAAARAASLAHSAGVVRGMFPDSPELT